MDPKTYLCLHIYVYILNEHIIIIFKHYNSDAAAFERQPKVLPGRKIHKLPDAQYIEQDENSLLNQLPKTELDKKIPDKKIRFEPYIGKNEGNQDIKNTDLEGDENEKIEENSKIETPVRIDGGVPYLTDAMMDRIEQRFKVNIKFFTSGIYEDTYIFSI